MTVGQQGRWCRCKSDGREDGGASEKGDMRYVENGVSVVAGGVVDNIRSW